MPILLKPVKVGVDFAVTLFMWVYFIFGFLLFFFPFYLLSFVFSKNREISFQKLNNRFFRMFMNLTRLVTPGLKMKIDDKARSIRSSVIICNHLSYLDPLLFVSIFEKQKTIVKNTFFSVPFFKWFLKVSGYIPSVAEGNSLPLVIKYVMELNDYFNRGGNLFVFPEGTRSRDGRLNSFNKGAFRIAEKSRAPLKIVYIRNTNRLFTPGKFFFNTCISNSIEIEYLATLEPDYDSGTYSQSETMTEARLILEERLSREHDKWADV
ncbi:1-acyl-sn-glycerol-3-phosphate acyltransferase [bacterium]|nr:1-acyl-sn-glycerol-3-phosphate acyltransferase [bacterium]